jgi:hypothetical protein
VPGRRIMGLTMGQILKFPDGASRRAPKDGTLGEAAATTATKPSNRNIPLMTGDEWNEFIRLLTPDEQQAFMADLFKLLARRLERISN